MDIDQSSDILAIDYNDEVEMGLRLKQFDYILYYAKKDEDEAQNIRDKLPLDGILFDDELPFENWKYSAELRNRNDLFLRSTFKFFVVTDNLADDYEFILEKNNAVQQDLKKQDQSIIPLWVTPKRELSDDAFDTLHGFTSLQGLDPNSPNFTTRVETMAKMPMFANRKAERARIQKSKLTGYLQDKKQKTGPNGEFKRQKRSNGDIHIHVNGDQIQGKRTQCFTVPVEFWKRFRRGRNDYDTGAYSMVSQPRSESMDTYDSYGSNFTADGAPSSNSSTTVQASHPMDDGLKSAIAVN